jgi:putative Mg2+ transporter-C (MgtC) family protein
MLSNEIPIILKIMLCAFLMFVLGKERQKKKRFVGPRTLMLVGCATTLLSTIGIMFENLFVLGGIITGVGFLCGGVITKKDGHVGGLTTAALIWLSSTIGISIGLELYGTAIFTTILSFFILRSKELFKKEFLTLKLHN